MFKLKLDLESEAHPEKVNLNPFSWHYESILQASKMMITNREK